MKTPFRPKSCIYRGPPTKLDLFIAEHADVVHAADQCTAMGPVHADVAVAHIARATGKDTTTVRQTLYAAGQRLWYDLILPPDWWQRGEPQVMLAKARAAMAARH